MIYSYTTAEMYSNIQHGLTLPPVFPLHKQQQFKRVYCMQRFSSLTDVAVPLLEIQVTQVLFVFVL